MQTNRILFISHTSLLLTLLVASGPAVAGAHQKLVNPGLNGLSGDCEALPNPADKPLGRWFCSDSDSRWYNEGQTPNGGRPLPEEGSGYLGLATENGLISYAEQYRSILPEWRSSALLVVLSGKATSSSTNESSIVGVGLIASYKEGNDRKVTVSEAAQQRLDVEPGSWEDVHIATVIPPGNSLLNPAIFATTRDNQAPNVYFDDLKLEIETCGPRIEGSLLGDTRIGDDASQPTCIGDSFDLADNSLEFGRWYCDNTEYVDWEPNTPGSVKPTSSPGNGRYADLLPGAGDITWSRFRQRVLLDASSISGIEGDTFADAPLRANFNIRYWGTNRDIQTRFVIRAFDAQGNELGSRKNFAELLGFAAAQGETDLPDIADQEPGWYFNNVSMLLPTLTHSLVVEAAVRSGTLTQINPDQPPGLPTRFYVDLADLAVARCRDVTGVRVGAGQGTSSTGVLGRGAGANRSEGLAIFTGDEEGKHLEYLADLNANAYDYIYATSIDRTVDDYFYYVVKPGENNRWQGMSFEAQVETDPGMPEYIVNSASEGLEVYRETRPEVIAGVESLFDQNGQFVSGVVQSTYSSVRKSVEKANQINGWKPSDQVSWPSLSQSIQNLDPTVSTEFPFTPLKSPGLFDTHVEGVAWRQAESGETGPFAPFTPGSDGGYLVFRIPTSIDAQPAPVAPLPALLIMGTGLLGLGSRRSRLRYE